MIRAHGQQPLRAAGFLDEGDEGSDRISRIHDSAFAELIDAVQGNPVRARNAGKSSARLCRGPDRRDGRIGGSRWLRRLRRERVQRPRADEETPNDAQVHHEMLNTSGLSKQSGLRFFQAVTGVKLI